LSNLDANLREHMQKEIRSIVTDEGITAVYVTHDQKEALSMSDVIVLLRDGVVQQVGSPDSIYYRPQNRFVAEFMGWPNMVEATVVSIDEERQWIVASSPLGTMKIQKNPDVLKPRIGDLLDVVVKQEDLRVVPLSHRHTDDNHFSLPLVRQVFHGDRLEVLCQAGDKTISIYTSARQRQNGPDVSFACSPSELHYFPHQPKQG
jgi:iron(III) transport system ATP-binding protein